MSYSPPFLHGFLKNGVWGGRRRLCRLLPPQFPLCPRPGAGVRGWGKAGLSTLRKPCSFLFVNKACNEAVAEIMQQLVSANLQVLRTFDLQMSRTTFTQCTCPNHGTEQCDCQLVVLLVYRDKLPPTSLVAHGHDGKTWFALVDSPEQRAAPRSE